MIINPVLYKEYIGFLRIRRIQRVHLVLLILLFVAPLGWLNWEVIFRGILKTPANAPEILITLVWIQYTLICLLAPGIAANAITREKEQQTWESLVFTLLLPREIILGKLIARLSCLFGIMALFLPAEVIGWIVSPHTDVGAGHSIPLTRFLLVLLTLCVTAVFFTTCGLFMSWITNRTLYAVMLSYTFVVGGLIIASTLLTIMLSYSLSSSNDPTENSPLLLLNPISLLVNAFDIGSGSRTVFNFLMGLLAYVGLSAAMLIRMIMGFRSKI